MSRSKLILFFFLIPLWCFAQSERETDFGTSLALELQKDLNKKFTISFEEELRLVTNDKGFDRAMSTLGVDYSFFDKRFKLGAYYCYIYMYNNKHYYESRHRYYLSLSYKQPLGDFTLSWRGRFQGTYRDENRGEYKINPKYVFRNKFDLTYTIFGSPWKPFVSCDISSTTNDPMGNELYKVRYQAGASWRLNRTDYLEFFVRYDNYYADDDPNVIGVGVGYKIKL